MVIFKSYVSLPEGIILLLVVFIHLYPILYFPYSIIDMVY